MTHRTTTGAPRTLFSDRNELQKANALLHLASSASEPAQKLEIIKALLSSQHLELRLVGAGLTFSFVRLAAIEDCEKLRSVLIECAPHLAPHVLQNPVSRLQFGSEKLPRNFNPALTFMFGTFVTDSQIAGDAFSVSPANNGVILTAGAILRKLLCVTGLELLYSFSVGFPRQELFGKFMDASQIEQTYFRFTDGIANPEGKNFYPYPVRTGVGPEFKPDEYCYMRIQHILRLVDRNARTLGKLLPEDAATRTEPELVAIFGNNTIPFREAVRMNVSSLAIAAGNLLHSTIQETDVNSILYIFRELSAFTGAYSEAKIWLPEEVAAVTGILLARKILSNPADILTPNGVA
jgi:hypothetical protein